MLRLRVVPMGDGAVVRVILYRRRRHGGTYRRTGTLYLDEREWDGCVFPALQQYEAIEIVTDEPTA